MRTLTTDVAIIGAGSAGLNARREVERAGKSALLIEAARYGTTCARTGCMPSKLLIAAAEAAHRARSANVFGVRIDPAAIRVDGRAVLERVRRERDRFVGFVVRDVEELPSEQRLMGRARFVGPTELTVGDRTTVRARAIVVATGSYPVVPPELAPLGELVLTSDSLFELDALPESVAVFGTGAIGLELGQALHHLGVRVAFYNPRGTVGSFTDPVVDAKLRQLLIAELDMAALGAQGTEVRKGPSGVLICHRDAHGGQHERHFSHVLAAVGRRPALEGLDLKAGGIALDQFGVPEFSRETTQCGGAPIFIAGDADGYRALLHEATDEGRIAGANAASFPEVRSHTRRVSLNITFTTPQLAMVGKTFREASVAPLAIGESSYENQGRARVIGQNRGHVRLYAERNTQTLIGAELFGPAVEHTAHLLAWAMQQRLTVSELLHMPVYHPTLEEGIRSALRGLARDLELIAECLPEDLGEGPGT